MTQCRLEWTHRLSLLVMTYLYLLLTYKLKGFILSVTIISLLDFNKSGLGGPTVRGLARPSLLNFKPNPAHFLKSKFGTGLRAARPCGALMSCLF